MKSTPDSSRLTELVQESRRIKLERSLEHAEKYLEEKLAERPNDRACLSALAVLLLEAGQYAKANHVTRRLSGLIVTNEAPELSEERDGLHDRRSEDIDSDDISLDLEVSRRLADRENHNEPSFLFDGGPDDRDTASHRSLKLGKPQAWAQAELGFEPPTPIIRRAGEGNQAQFRPIHTALNQANLDLDDMLPISRESANSKHEISVRKPEPPFDRLRLEREELEPRSYQEGDEDTDLYGREFDVDSLAEEISNDDDDDDLWSEELDREEKDLEGEKFLDGPAEIDQEYAEDAFLESPIPEELHVVPDASSVRERAQEVALELVSEYGLSAEYEPVLTRIFTEYWWGRCKTSMREQLELAVSAKVLDMAREVRGHWAEHPEYHQNIFEYRRYYGYESLPWRLAIRLVDAYRQYPQFEEIVGFLEFCYGEWDTRYSLQRQFSSYYLLIRHIVERSEADGLDPSNVSDIFRKIWN